MNKLIVFCSAEAKALLVQRTDHRVKSIAEASYLAKQFIELPSFSGRRVKSCQNKIGGEATRTAFYPTALCTRLEILFKPLPHFLWLNSPQWIPESVQWQTRVP